MSSLYDDLRSVASGVIEEFAQGTVKYVEMTVPAGATPDEPGVPVPDPTTINAVVRPVSTKYVDGSHIVQSDKQLSMAGGGIEPTMDDFIEIDGVPYKIVEILPRPAAGDPVAYTIILRR